MSDKIFLVQGDRLVAMERSRYSLEDHLQELLARYPDLMPGEQLDPREPRRWLLVSRETGIPDAEGAIDRWSLDHLFLDQDGVPTLVEAKRSTDPRIRREVVGQLLEYAANAQSYWTVDQIRDQVLEGSVGQTEEDRLRDVLGINDVADFWQKVKSNLQAGRLRLIFVADQIPRELKRMIEFLNAQMDPAEVLGIELPQFIGSQMQTIVPRLIGNTAQAIGRKTPDKRMKTKWDEESYFVELESSERGKQQSGLVRELLAWLKGRGIRIWWGEGTTNASFVATYDVGGHGYQLVRVNAQGKLSVLTDLLRNRPAFEGQDLLKEVVDWLNIRMKLQIPGDAKRPGFEISRLAAPPDMQSLKELVDSLISRAKAAHLE